MCTVLTESGCRTGPVHVTRAVRSRPSSKRSVSDVAPGSRGDPRPRGRAASTRAPGDSGRTRRPPGHPAGGPPGVARTRRGDQHLSIAHSRTTRQRGHRANPCKLGARPTRRPPRDYDDHRGHHRPVGEPAQPQPTPPRQPRRPVTRRRTPSPPQPHHHPARHDITNPPQNPRRSRVANPSSTSVRVCPTFSTRPYPRTL